MSGGHKIIQGDSLEVLKTFEANSVDAVVCDPPYGLKFMGKKWDYDVPSVELWTEVLRVLKPGGHALIACGTRTQHRMTVNIEDAGFEIRDVVTWLYGSGFPKSLDVSKAIDKAAGAERAKVPRVEVNGQVRKADCEHGWKNSSDNSLTFDKNAITPDAKRWQGWGTALKPACEFWTLARKPLEKGMTVADNVLKYGTGALNIDACRIGYASEADKKANTEALDRFNSTSGKSGAFMASKSIQPNLAGTSLGRWPANLILDEESAAALDEQSGRLGPGPKNPAPGNMGLYQSGIKETFGVGYGDSGGASRFFYVAKASKAERNRGCEHFGAKEKQGNRPNSKDMSGKFPDHDHRPSGGNNHPTVKPIKLMQYLIQLITPTGGVVLDPFAGSGSTGVAAKQLGFSFIGIELEQQYVEIAQARIEGA